VAEGGELRAQKRCGSKPPLMAPQSRAYIMSNPRATRGHPLGVKPRSDPEEDSVNEKGLVVETSAQSINRRHGSYGRGDRSCQPEVPRWMVSSCRPILI
jgi:hypothetical protein